jgi:hypothetical protein
MALLACLFALQPIKAADERATGSITGTIDRPNETVEVIEVTAIDRNTDKRYPGKFDAKSQRFTIENLPAPGVYDCIIDFAGARLEGINLRVPRSDFEEEQPLSEEDVETIRRKALGLNQFEDVVEILTIEGNIQHAAVLMNKLRTKPFFGSKPGEVVWRAELWHFERPEETWVKVQDELFLVLYRERIPRAEYDKKSLMFDPALGGVTLSAESPAVDLGRVPPPDAKPGIRLQQRSSP